MPLYADIIVPLALPGPFTYAIPERWQQTIQVGMRVVVNFGKTKFYTGIVYRLHSDSPTYATIKSIADLLDDCAVVFPSQLLLWEFVATYYRATLGEVYIAAVPTAMKLESENMVAVNLDLASESELSPEEEHLLDLVVPEGKLSVAQLTHRSDAKHLMAMIRNLAERGILLIGQDLKPGYKPRYETYFRLTDSYATTQAQHDLLDQLSRSVKQKQLLQAYLMHQSNQAEAKLPLLPRKKFLEEQQCSLSTYHALEKRGVLQTVSCAIERLATHTQALQQAPPLTAAQQQAFQEINEGFQSYETVLLHGVTSSGKTEIYIKLIEQTLSRGEQVLLLVPEIGLTTQLATRLRRVFGDTLGVYHSRFSDYERVEIWRNLLLDKGYQIILGVRSSVFLPFKKLGLVIVDEEHDYSYKQQDPAPRYHARNIAQMLAHLHHGHVLLASATPSVESYTHCLTGKYCLVQLNERYQNLPMPHLQLVDLKECYHKRQMKGHFSLALQQSMEETLSQGRQVILFQNRRGYAPYVCCTNCGWVPRCTNCDVSLTYHKNFDQLSCHYCGQTRQLPDRCPECHEPTLTTRGFGTEQIEEEVNALFPEARVARLDLDTTRTKNGYSRIIEQFEQQEIDILIGTQMVSKGLDFAHVSLIGVLNADNLLLYPDFRANERAFQLLEQVGGRAGRKEIPGKVLIQTSQPNNPLFTHLIQHDFRAFFDQQMMEREQFHYPPYYRLVRIAVRHRLPEVTNLVANEVAEQLRHIFGNRVLGPNLPPVGRIQNLYIKHILLKVEVTASFEKAKMLLDKTISDYRNRTHQNNVQILIDVDPM